MRGISKTIGAGLGVLEKRIASYCCVADRARANPRLARMGSTVAAIFVGLGVLDVLSTNWALSVGAIEANSFMVTLQEKLGDFWYIPKLALQSTVASMIVWSPNRATIAIMALMCGWTSSVVSNNFLIALSLS